MDQWFLNLADLQNHLRSPWMCKNRSHIPALGIVFSWGGAQRFVTIAMGGV